jgi:hypothetical protein
VLFLAGVHLLHACSITDAPAWHADGTQPVPWPVLQGALAAEDALTADDSLLLRLWLAYLSLSKLSNIFRKRIIKADTLRSRLCITCGTTGQQHARCKLTHKALVVFEIKRC